MKSRKCGMLTACLSVLVAGNLVHAADELDRMLVVESAIPKAAATNNSLPSAAAPAIAPVEPAKPVLPASEPVPSTAVNPPVVNQPPAVPAQSSVVNDSEAATLRSELKLREQELARSNKEIERLKEIVRRIHAANRRESLVFNYNMAAIYRSNMMYNKAEEAYLKALEIDPRDAGVHFNLAILYDDNFKDKKKAKYHYEKFLELAPDDPDAPKVREWLASIL